MCKPESTEAIGSGVDTRDDEYGKANGPSPIPIELGTRTARGSHTDGTMAARSGHGGRASIGGRQEVPLAHWAGASSRDSHWVVQWVAQALAAPSGWKRNGSPSGQGAIELGFPGPALDKIEDEPSGDKEGPPPEGLGGCKLLAQTDAHRPAVQVMRHHLARQPSAVSGETATCPVRREMIQRHRSGLRIHHVLRAAARNTVPGQANDDCDPSHCRGHAAKTRGHGIQRCTLNRTLPIRLSNRKREVHRI